MGDIDFERFNIRANYTNVAGTTVSPADLSSYSFNIESNGRGRGMFMFNRSDQPLYVTTYAEIYIIEKEYITLQEAKNGNDLPLLLMRLAFMSPRRLRLLIRLY